MVLGILVTAAADAYAVLGMHSTVRRLKQAGDADGVWRTRIVRWPSAVAFTATAAALRFTAGGVLAGCVAGIVVGAIVIGVVWPRVRASHPPEAEKGDA
jgi:hypothetical protein